MDTSRLLSGLALLALGILIGSNSPDTFRKLASGGRTVASAAFGWVKSRLSRKSK